MYIKPDFRPAYTVSNENLRWATIAVPNIKSVLTVTGSGDQALFYTLAGIKIIDTFDITQNAAAIQDIKYAAIKHLSLTEYINLLKQLHCALDIQSIPQFQKMKPFLPERARNIINQLHELNLARFDIFGNGLGVDSYPENLPNNIEYQTLKTKLRKPFNFIHVDLKHLAEKLSKKYDLINISNIFDYGEYDGKTQGKILLDLSEHLTIGGRIAHLPQWEKFDYKQVHMRAQSGTPEIIYEKTIKSVSNDRMILFQRIR